MGGELQCSTQLLERAPEENVCSREDTPTEDRVEAALVYTPSGSREPSASGSVTPHQAVHEWYAKLADLFEPESDRHRLVVVEETTVTVEDEEVSVWAAVNRATFEVIHVEVSPDRSEMDAFLFLRTAFERYRGESVVIVDRGPWNNLSRICKLLLN